MIPALRLTILLLYIPPAAAVAAQATPPAAPVPATPRPAPVPRPKKAPLPPMEPATPAPDVWHEFEMPAPKKFHGEMPDMKFELPEYFEKPDMRFETPKAHFEMPDMSFKTPKFESKMEWSADDFVTPRPFRGERYSGEPFAMRPRAPWLQGDPADSMYKAAYELLNRGEWRRAASGFAAIPQRFPNSGYAPDALYWQAFALYRIGGTDDLQAALRSLETLRTKFPSAKTQSDAAALTTRIRGTLASRGDRASQQVLRQTMSEQGQSTCDREDIAVRAEALRYLSQNDPASVVATVKRVLTRKDECSAPLRRQAVYVLGQSGDAEAPAMLREVALNDPESEVRSAAIQYLARSPSDIAVNTLDEVLRTSTDQSVQRTAARALASNPSPRAKQAVRSLIERADAPERLRIEAVAGFEKSDRTTDEDAAYLRGVYPKIDNPRVKARIARVIGHLGGETNDQWLLGLMRNNDEPVEVRTAALSRVASRNMPIGDAVKLYSTVADRQMREQLINIYGQRREPEATDKLIDIVKNDTDPNLRKHAINALTRKNDPRATKLLLEIIDK
jgi:HEAT repeat protein